MSQERECWTDENRSAKGAYVLAEAGSLPRQVTLLATGSEVALAIDARIQLEAAGIPTAVVSMPCWELFEAQAETYRDAILQPGTVTVAVEAGLRFGWERWIGRDGGFVVYFRISQSAAALEEK